MGNTIRTLRPEARGAYARQGLNLANNLSKDVTFMATLADIRQFTNNVELFSRCLEADPEEMKSTIREYLRAQYYASGLPAADFRDPEFYPKKNGTQLGWICRVFKGQDVTRLFIKTHQNGPLPNSPAVLRGPDTVELFVYKLLELVGIGPAVWFIVPRNISTKVRTLYIATKDANITLLGDLTASNYNPQALLQIDLICHLLCLTDCCTNSGNCGQVMPEGNAMIIDFRVHSGHNKPVDFKAFTDTSATSSYGGLMGKAMDTPLETKTELVRKSLEDWNLPPKIDEAFCHILQFVKETRCDVEFHNNILEQYVADVKWTLEKLQEQL
eukprot:TRINITY_DN145_c0_g1_i1.p1 TRINITY_DN145_c0_g1~~TRINITY_DN145_c0_g1_i1.p1  ORF type:complete len:351 (-),score=44.91 TRINITY_DN145_c0_g1_i1:70-1053(-)